MFFTHPCCKFSLKELVWNNREVIWSRSSQSGLVGHCEVDQYLHHFNRIISLYCYLINSCRSYSWLMWQVLIVNLFNVHKVMWTFNYQVTTQIHKLPWLLSILVGFFKMKQRSKQKTGTYSEEVHIILAETFLDSRKLIF